MFAAGAVPANALTLMDFIRGGPGKRDSRPDNGLPGVHGNLSGAQRNVDPQPLPKVAGPQYHVYKPEAARVVRTDGFAAAGRTGSERFLATANVSALSDVAAALEGFYAKNESRSGLRTATSRTGRGASLPFSIVPANSASIPRIIACRYQN